MLGLGPAAAMVMLFLSTGDLTDNPWKARVSEAVRQAEAKNTSAAVREALETAWKADDWQAGLRLAEGVLEKRPHDLALRGCVTRALWRAGRIEQAERVASRLLMSTTDRVALRALITQHASRGQHAKALKLAQRLEGLRPHAAEDLYELFGVRFLAGQLDGLGQLLREAETLADPNNGYPEMYVPESIEGVADFLDAVGTEPLNQVTEYGAAALPPLVMLRLPSCEALINGRGPYRFVVDTGGSNVLSLDRGVAAELGLESLAQASVRGVSGRQETGQVLVDELRINTIVCKRVVTRTFDVRGAIMNAADGIIGTGIFSRARMTLDFAGGQIIVAPSGHRAAPGEAVDFRLVGDAKLVVLVTLEGQRGVALLDTGADAVALAPSALKRLFPDRAVQSYSTGLSIGVGSGQQTEVSFGSGVELQMGGRTFKNYGGLGLDVLDETLSPLLGVQIDILIGMPTFREMKTCTVDFPKCKLWIDWLERP